jgi:iron complex transport system substrate-binding protein
MPQLLSSELRLFYFFVESMKHTEKIRRGCLPALTLGLCLAANFSAYAADPATRVVVDELGRSITVPLQIDRIVSLAPSATEMVYALGLGEKLVGVSSFCDYPEDVRNKTRVGQPMNPSLESIVALRPDVVLGSSTANDVHTVEGLDNVGVPLYGITDPHSVDEIFASILRLAELTGATKEGEALVSRLSKELRAVEASVAGRRKPAALLAIWLEPLIATGDNTFLADVLRRAGADSITAGMKTDWPRLSLETVAERDPEVLIFTTAHGIAASFDRLRDKPPWRSLRAVRNGRIIHLDEALFRPGPRIVNVIADLAAQLHPEESAQRSAQP